MAATEKPYHERQEWMMCALHTLNNLFQDSKAFTRQELDSICYELNPNAFINPHKNVLGLGNYDVNVLMVAVQKRDYEAVWFDRRLPIDLLNLDNIFGFIINKPSGMNIFGVSLPIKRPHWFAVRRIDSVYYSLDSKLSAPLCIGSGSKLAEFLQNNLTVAQTELLLVVEKDVAEARSWRREEHA